MYTLIFAVKVSGCFYPGTAGVNRPIVIDFATSVPDPGEYIYITKETTVCIDCGSKL